MSDGNQYEAVVDRLERFEARVGQDTTEIKAMVGKITDVLTDSDTGLVVRLRTTELEQKQTAKDLEAVRAEVKAEREEHAETRKVLDEVRAALALAKKVGAGVAAAVGAVNLPQLADALKHLFGG